MNLLLRWALNALCLLLLPLILDAVQVDSLGTALIAAAVIGCLNLLIRPALLLLTLPITVVTLGLFAFVINGAIFWFAASFIEGFAIDGFGWAIVSAAIYSLITTLLAQLLTVRQA